jgi:hypothetical protein
MRGDLHVWFLGMLTIINIQYNWVNAIPTHSIMITRYIHQQKKFLIIFVNVLILHYLHTKTYFLTMKLLIGIHESKIFIITPCCITYIH